MHPVSPTPNAPTVGESVGRLPEARGSAGGSAPSSHADPVSEGLLCAPAAGGTPGSSSAARGPGASGRSAPAARGADGSSGEHVNGKKNGPAKVEPPQRLEDVFRQMGRHHAQALMLEYLAEICADSFRGSEARGPRKVLQLPNGAKCRAEVDDVLEVESTLRRLAAEARGELDRLKGASVVVPPLSPKTAAPSWRRPPEGECVADAPEAKPAAGSADPTSSRTSRASA